METISNIAVKDDLEISGNINGTVLLKTWVNLLFYYWLDCRSICFQERHYWHPYNPCWQ
jgi:hypothetical protein